MKRFPFIFSIFLLLISCKEDELNIIVESEQILAGIPSASGITAFNDGYFAIGDDSPYLFELNQNFEIIGRNAIFSTVNLDGDRITKAHKPDFEAIETIDENEIILFGSGSLSPQRDICIRYFPKTKSHISYHITPFYDKIRALPEMAQSELNIEGIAYHEGQLYLLNRENNLILSFNYKTLIASFENDINFPNPTSTIFELPTINGISAGFSGATVDPIKNSLIFTASVENNLDAYSDGAVLGSFIGSIPIKNKQLSSELQVVELISESSPVKVESITLKKIGEQSNFYLTTDSDGGESLLIKGELKSY